MMTLYNWATFQETWAVDFEFTQIPGEQPNPFCMVAQELISGRTISFWEDDLKMIHTPPYPTNKSSILVAYYASAEIGCHLALGWPLPVFVLDLYSEFRNLTNGSGEPAGLLHALMWFGLPAMDALEKDSMRQLALRGGPWTLQEKKDLLEYCESDVLALTRLFPKMKDLIDLPRALLRGHFMKTAAKIEWNGVPLDKPALTSLRTHWNKIKDRLIARIDSSYGVYQGGAFKQALFAKWLVKNGIPWPRLESGKLDLSDETFKEMARIYPKVNLLRELRVALSQMRLESLAVGADGRNRCLLSAFRAVTGRNQPKSKQFIFGPSVWLRGLIRPSPGYGLAYIDWAQQEFGIAAALSNDPLMLQAYRSGDPYLSLAKQSGAVPPDATKESHSIQRNLFKTCTLAVQYGGGAKLLAERIGQPEAKARELLRLHRETYRCFWRWSDAALDRAMLYGTLWTVFGWNIRSRADSTPGSLRNFPMQANGAEMLRLACCYAIERGIRICAPVHDAILIEAPLEELDSAVEITQRAMADASAAVLAGFRLHTEVKMVRYPERYMDGRGIAMWETVWGLIKEIENEENSCV